MKLRIVVLLLVIPLCMISQDKKQYKVRTIAFYNVENLFDTKNDTLIFDDDRTPEGKDNWTLERYQNKLTNIARVIAEIGAEQTKTSPDIVGLSEVENKQVIEDLIAHPLLRQKGYAIVHFDSPDERGIDVALLYKKAAFLPSSYASHRLLIHDDNQFRNYTRDQLVVGGLLDNEQFYFTVNHWPSRSGGEARSKPNRMAAAKLNRRITDSILRLDVSAKIITMGDFNDDPTDDSIQKILRAEGKAKNLEEGDLFNPMVKLYKKGIGSLAYRDKWNLFDQIVFTPNLRDKNDGLYHFWKVAVFNPPYLLSKKGQYKGYPFRTYAGGSYAGGYSDHFPVYMYLIRESAPLTPPKKEH